MNYIRSTLAEFYKMRHSVLCVFWIFPFCYALFWYACTLFTGLAYQPSIDVIRGYFEVFGGFFPLLVGLFTAKEADMEGSAGQFQVLLFGVTSRRTAFLGKFTCVVLNLFFCLLIAIGVFCMLYQKELFLFWKMAWVLSCSACIFLCLLHLWVSFAFGGGASIGLGFVEMLLGFLSATILVDDVWYYIPCTWIVRLSEYVTYRHIYPYWQVFYLEIRKWVFVGGFMTAAFLFLVLFWFSRWEGRMTVE